MQNRKKKKILRKLTQSLWSCLQSWSAGIGSFNFYFCLYVLPSVCVSEFSLVEEGNDTHR